MRKITEIGQGLVEYSLVLILAILLILLFLGIISQAEFDAFCQQYGVCP